MVPKSFRRLGYSQYKTIVNCHHEPWFRIKYRLHMLHWIINLFRAPVMIYVFFNLDSDLKQYDFAACFVSFYRDELNIFFLIILGLGACLGIEGIRTFFMSPVESLPFRVLCDCIVNNPDQYDRSLDTEENVRIKKSARLQYYINQYKQSKTLRWLIPNILYQWTYCRLMIWLDSWRYLDRVDEEKFRRNKMKMFEHACFKSRAYILMWAFGLDILNFGLQIFVVLLVVSCSSIYVAKWIQELPCFSLTLQYGIYFALEVMGVWYSILFMLRLSLIMTCGVTTPYYIFTTNLQKLNQTFAKIKNRSHQRALKKKAKLVDEASFQRLDFIYKEHAKLCFYIIYADEDIWSQSLFNYACISVPLNAALMCIVIFESLEWKTRSVFLIISIVHIVTSLFPFLSLASVSSHFHTIRKHIPEMQLYLTEKHHQRFKIKLDDLYQRLTSGKKISFTFGLLGDITFRGLFEAALGYVAAFFLVVGLYQNSSKHN